MMVQPYLKNQTIKVVVRLINTFFWAIHYNKFDYILNMQMFFAEIVSENCVTC